MWGYKKLQGAPKTYKRRKKPIRKTKKKVATFFLLFFGVSKYFVASLSAKNFGYAFGFIHIYLIELCYEQWKL